MLGLCKGLYMEAWLRRNGGTRLPLSTLRNVYNNGAYMKRSDLDMKLWTAFPAHRHYYRLLDACPLRMS